MSAFAAVDLGASSGRVMVWRATNRNQMGIELVEAHRFPNVPIRTSDGFHWDILRLYGDVLDGLRAAQRIAGDITSIGIDSWAIDYGLLDSTGALIGNPFHYRDGRSQAAVSTVHQQIGPEGLYARTGLQFLPFTTLYQLAASAGTPALERANRLLLIPDLLTYWLAGTVGAEVTNASTTGLFDVTTQNWSTDIPRAVGLAPGLLPPLTYPGEVVGRIRGAVASDCGLGPSTVITAVGSHDTASAVVAVPAQGRRFAFISCGTWSLVGVELDRPVLTPESRAANFTNEGGVDGRIRYLRNVMGLWLLQESLRVWQRQGLNADLAVLVSAAAALPVGGPVVDPNEARFLPPGDMPERIAASCRDTGQAAPEGQVAIVRCILDSLAAAYARTVSDAVRLSGQAVDVVHVVGGGARNTLLCQLTADACGIPVLAGPVEGTALGNILVQGRAHGALTGDLEELRAILGRGQELRRYDPGRNSVSPDRSSGSKVTE